MREVYRPDIRHHGIQKERIVMSSQFIVAVYRDKGISIQYHSFTDMLEACRKASQLKGERWVRKVELSVIIHTW